MSLFSKKKCFVLLSLLFFPGCGFGLRKFAPSIPGLSSSSNVIVTPTPEIPTPVPDPEVGGGGGGGEEGGEGGESGGGEEGGESGGSGGASSGQLYAFVLNQQGQSITRYSVNRETAEVTHLGTLSDPSVLTAPKNMLGNSNGKCLMVTAGDFLVGYLIGESGELTQTTLITPTYSPDAMAFSPTANYLYVTSRVSHRLMYFAFNHDLCTVTPISSVSAYNTPIDIRVEAGGGYLYLLALGEARLQLFSLDPATGGPNAQSGYGFTVPQSMAVSPVSGNILVSHSSDQFAVTGRSGNAFAPPAYPQNLGTFFTSMIVSKSGGAFYAASPTTNKIHVRMLPEVGETTGINQINALGTYPEKLAMDKQGKILLATYRESASFGVMKIAENETLEMITTSSTGARPVAIVIAERTNEAPGGASGSNSNGPFYTYVANAGAPSISRFSANTIVSGIPELSFVDTHEMSSEFRPSKIAAAGGGKCLLAVSDSSTKLISHSVGQSGALQVAQTLEMPFSGFDIAISNTGRVGYVLSHDVARILIIEIDPANCQVAFRGHHPLGTMPLRIAHDPNGAFLVVVDADHKMKLMHTLATYGAPTDIGTVDALAPIALAIHPTNHRAYLTGGVSMLGAYNLASDGITYAFAPGPFAAYSASLVFDPGGRFAYSSEIANNQLTMYHVEENGSLTNVAYAQSEGIYPNNVALLPNGKALLTTNRQSNTLALHSLQTSIGVPAITFTKKLDTGPVPESIVVIAP